MENSSNGTQSEELKTHPYLAGSGKAVNTAVYLSLIHILKGIVDIYPDVNPLGLDTGSRGIPMFDLDMNRRCV